MSAFPDWVEPMAATLTQERFTGPDWLFERKLDGIRLLAFKRGSTVTLYSRNRLPQNHVYPTVVEAIEKLPVKDAILDGEATGVWGHSTGRTTYHVFDVLRLDGRDVTLLPLEERRALPARGRQRFALVIQRTQTIGERIGAAAGLQLQHELHLQLATLGVGVVGLLAERIADLGAQNLHTAGGSRRVRSGRIVLRGGAAVGRRISARHRAVRAGARILSAGARARALDLAELGVVAARRKAQAQHNCRERQKAHTSKIPQK